MTSLSLNQPASPSQSIVPLTKGKVAIVDAEDYKWISEFKWQALSGTRGHCPAARQVMKNCKTTTILMHRAIWEHHNGPIPNGLETDHVNGNPLDNRLANLRVCTHSQNMVNRDVDKTGNTSKYRGVYLHGNKWQAGIYQNRVRIHLGTYSTEEEAAQSYDLKAKEIFGEFARLNFPEGK